jgi:hypothetical protein
VDELKPVAGSRAEAVPVSRDYINATVEEVSKTKAATEARANGTIAVLSPRMTAAAIPTCEALKSFNADVAATEGTALAEYRKALESPGSPSKHRLNDLAEPAATNVLKRLGRLLGETNANHLFFGPRTLPASTARHPATCSPSDIATVATAVEMWKCLVMFHGTVPTRATLKIAISVGNSEVVIFVWDLLPQSDRERRADLIAAEFHQMESLLWLLRDATVYEREAAVTFMLERH